MGGGKYETQWEVKWKDWDKKHKESTWPKLAKMAKQYLAAPFSSAGVERVFSAAGKMLTRCTTTCASLRRTAPSSTRCLQHSTPSDGDEVAAVAGGVRGGNSGPCRRPANLLVNVWVRGSNLLTGS